MDARIEYFHKDELCSVVTLNEQTGCVKTENFTNSILDRAFGINESPTLEDVEDFIEDRCFPRSRPNVKETLRFLGLDFYEPLEIVYKTHGVIHGDFYWLRFEDQKDITWEKDILSMYQSKYLNRAD